MLPPEIGDAHLLYLQAEPHRSLFVEVDAVKGAEPSAIELNGLQCFLDSGARSNVMCRPAARGYSAPLTGTTEVNDGGAAGGFEAAFERNYFSLGYFKIIPLDFPSN
jgi:hypothetical protein